MKLKILIIAFLTFCFIALAVGVIPPDREAPCDSQQAAESAGGEE